MEKSANKTKILIVEDEMIVLLDLKSAITKLGYEVIDTASNYDEAIKSVAKNQPDLIMMDVNLNNSKDGIEIASKILETKYIPIIYLTAYTDETTIQRAIKTNPVGYVIKPFKRDDLKVAIQLGLFKSQQTSPYIPVDSNKQHLGNGYYYNFNNDILYFKDVVIKLSTNEVKLIKLLLSARGNIVSYEQLEYEIWGENTMSNSTLRTLIYRLRSKLDNKLISNVYSQGCKFNVVTE
ncbi:MAG: response regulator [Arcobacteraceae bacterium]